MGKSVAVLVSVGMTDYFASHFPLSLEGISLLFHFLSLVHFCDRTNGWSPVWGCGRTCGRRPAVEAGAMPWQLAAGYNKVPYSLSFSLIPLGVEVKFDLYVDVNPFLTLWQELPDFFVGSNLIRNNSN